MAMQTGNATSGDDTGPLCLLMVDGPNVMIKIKELWELSGEQRPDSFGLRYDAVAEFIRQEYEISPSNLQKTIFIKKTSQSTTDEESVDKQDKFRFALERAGWDVEVRAAAESTSYSDKQNDIDDDLIEMGKTFLEEAIPNDVLVLMTNDFAASPRGESTTKLLDSAARLGLRTAVISFLPIAPELHRARFAVFDSRDIPGAFEVAPPKLRTIADVAPGSIESFDRHAVKVIGRRPNKLEESRAESSSGAAWTAGTASRPRREIPPPPPRPASGQRSIPRPPTATDVTDLRQSLEDVPVVPSTTWVK